MGMATRLTDAIARAAKPSGKSLAINWDDEVKGFGLRVTKAGARAWVLAYRAQGVQRQITIGSFPDWSVKQAREKAKEFKRQVDDGGDPMRDRRVERRAPTIADLADLYRRVHLPKKRPTSQLGDGLILAKHILPALGNRKVEAVRHADVADLHRQIAKATPIAANRTIALLSRLFSIAITEEMRADNPCKGVDKSPENRRERYLSEGEIARLMDVLDQHPRQSSANAVRLLLLTGARRGEVLGATWQQFDLDKGTWTKPAATTKQAKTHHLPLSAAALELLRAMKMEQDAAVHEARTRRRIMPAPSRLFPGNGAGQVQQSLKRFWASICKDAGIDDAHLHDLRHTHASILASKGISLPTIGAMLGHTQPATTHRYAHLFTNTLRDAADVAGAFISNAKDKVVPMTRKPAS
jgi:integrase